jgi:pseudouridine synthase
MEVRLQKIMAEWGIASRRQAESMIQESRVKVNGILAHLGQKVDPETDQISIDGRIFTAAQVPRPIYLLMYKPLGVVCTCDDPQNRPTVLELLPLVLRAGLGIHPVGRLDQYSTGALILTNDGDLTFGLTHPRHQMTKVYDVFVQGYPTPEVLKVWCQGVVLAGEKTRPAEVRLIQYLPDQASHLEIILREGRNRQIRRVAKQLGYPVIKLHRTAIGSIQLQTSATTCLDPGDYRDLTNDEIKFLKNQIKSTSIKHQLI